MFKRILSKNFDKEDGSLTPRTPNTARTPRELSILDIQEQMGFEKECFKDQIKILADTNDAHIQRIKELEKKLEERNSKIENMTREIAILEEQKKQSEKAQKLASAAKFEEFQKNQLKCNLLLQAIQEKLGQNQELPVKKLQQPMNLHIDTLTTAAQTSCASDDPSPQLESPTEAPIISFREAQFMSWDMDEDGVISHEDIKKMVKRHRKTISDDFVNQWIQTADTNKDGVVDFDEFVNAKMWNTLAEYLKI